MIRPHYLGLCAVLLLAGAAQGATLLGPADYVPEQLLPAPPPEGSPAAKAELAEPDRIRAARTAQDSARADRDFKTRNASIFAAAIGKGFDLAHLPATA